MNEDVHILHISDLHLGEHSEVVPLLETIKRARMADGQSHGDSRSTPSLAAVDLVAVTGDFLVKADPSGYIPAASFLRQVADLFELEADRILIIPGNHDVTFGSDEPYAVASWEYYGQFAQDWYSGHEETVFPVSLHTGNGQFPPSAFVVDHAATLGMRCLLLSSVAGLANSDLLARQLPPEATRTAVMQMGLVGADQLEAFDGVLSTLSAVDREGPPCIALIHHHLFAARAPAGSEFDVARRNMLLDFPDVTSWLARNRCLAVLHGHRHIPYFAHFHSQGIPAGLVEFAVRDAPQEPLDEVDIDFVVTGVAPLDAGPGPHALQVLRVVPRPVADLEVPVMATPYLRVGGTWQNSVPGHQSVVLSSSPTLSELQRERYDAECFFTEELTAATIDPSVGHNERGPQDIRRQRAEIKDLWLWNHLDKIRNADPFRWFLPSPTPAGSLEESGSGSDDAQPQTVREQVLADLVDSVNLHNRRRSVFGLLPAQLYGIYSLSALLFSEHEVNEKAAQEFQRGEWDELLRSESSRRRSRSKTHLEAANDHIARAAGEWWKKAGPEQPRVLEFGFGALRTLRWVMQDLWDANCRSIQYLGVDVNLTLVNKALGLLRAGEIGDLSAERLKPLSNSDGPWPDNCLKQGTIAQWLSDHADEHVEQFDLILASYCMHHSVSNRLLYRAITDGTLGRVFLGDSGQDSEGSENRGILKRAFTEAVQHGSLFSDAIVAGSMSQTELASQLWTLMEAYSRLSESRLDWLGRVSPQMPENAGFLDQALQLAGMFPDRQREAYRAMFSVLRPGGLVTIADPNGYSRTFNRQQIIHDWPIAMAHFSDWPQTVALLGDSGFTDITVARQIRKLDLSVGEIPVHTNSIDWILESMRSLNLPSSSITLADHLNWNEIRRDVFTAFSQQSDDPFSLRYEDPTAVKAGEIEDQHLGYIVTARKP